MSVRPFVSVCIVLCLGVCEFVGMQCVSVCVPVCLGIHGFVGVSVCLSVLAFVGVCM